MIHHICKHYNISHYCLDMNRVVYLRYVATHNSYPALIYYAVNNHMYLIKDRKLIDSLVKSTVDTEKYVQTNAFSDDEQHDNDIFKDAIIYDNIPIDELKDLKTGIVIYPTNDISEIFEQTIEKYEIIPTRIKNKEYHISQFIFSIAEVQKLYIMADPNDLKKLNYKRV